jgi:hypothetical protein
MNPLRPEHSQRYVGFHESGHMVLSLLLDDYHGSTGVSIWPDNHGWEGICRVMPTMPGAARCMPDLASTTPLEWRRATLEAWRSVVDCYAGPAAGRIFAGQAVDHPQLIRSDYSAGYDEPQARGYAEHHWPEAQWEVVLDAGAMTAVELMKIPEIWRAVAALGEYLAVRRNVTVNEAEVIVRRFLPQSIQCPGANWALSLAKS